MPSCQRDLVSPDPLSHDPAYQNGRYPRKFLGRAIKQNLYRPMVTILWHSHRQPEAG